MIIPIRAVLFFKTAEEMEAETAALPRPEPTQAERLEALEDAVMEMLIM